MNERHVSDRRPDVMVRHHYPPVPDLKALEEARDLWATGLVRQFRRTRAQDSSMDPPGDQK